MHVSKSTFIASVICASSWMASDAFVQGLTSTSTTRTAPSDRRTTSQLLGAFNKGNKQAALMKKMQDAKRQRETVDPGASDEDDAAKALSGKEAARVNRLSDEEMKKQNDLKRFEQLLNSESATSLNYGIDGSNYKTQAQEEEELDAGSRGSDRLFEGDPAPTEPFEDLINIVTGNALGKNGASRVVPWLNTKSTSKPGEFLVVLSDPREKSSELRTALKNVAKSLPADVVNRLIVINADSPGENRRFLKKNGIDNLAMYCDEKREWMREYTVLGEKRWAMCMMVLADGRVQKLVREVDVELAPMVVKNAVKNL